MLRLRTTAGLSALALAIGIAGTGWLSSPARQWRQPSDRVAMVGRINAVPRTPSKMHRSRGPDKRVPQPRRAWRQGTVGDGVAHAAMAAIPVALQPLATPADTSQSWDQLRGHLDGRVLVHVRIDGVGAVESASVIASSGDLILDQHALRSVRGWRFAVPSGHPDGLSGELPMFFSSQERGVGVL